MKVLPFILSFFWCGALCADESGVVYVYQVSDGLALDEPQMARIYCHDYHAVSGIPPFALISAKHIPPTNAGEPLQDHNLVSASNIAVSVTTEEPWVITIDATGASIPKRFDHITLPELLKLTSEAVEKTAKDWKLSDYKIVIKDGSKRE